MFCNRHWKSQSETVRLKRSPKDLREYYANLGSGIITSKNIVSKEIVNNVLESLQQAVTKSKYCWCWYFHTSFLETYI